MKRPSLQWYPGDHRRDTGVQACSFEARALWREMLDLMHDGDPRGYLTAGGEPIAPAELARIVGVTPAQVKRWLQELERRKVFSRTAAGLIYSRRMVRDEDARRFQAEQGDASTRGVSGSRGGKTGALFNFLLERFGGCLYCGSKDALELHRIVPGRKNGLYEPGNVLLLCHDDHQDAGSGELSVSAILKRAGVSTALDLFRGFSHPRYQFDTPHDTPRGNESIPSAVADCGLRSAVAVVPQDPLPESSNKRSGTTGGDTVDSATVAAPPMNASVDTATEAFMARFYADASDVRRADVARQLVACQSAPGAKVGKGKGQYVRAWTPERLVAKIREVMVQGVAEPNAAIVVLLMKLGDTSDGSAPGQVAAVHEQQVVRREEGERTRTIADAYTWLDDQPEIERAIDLQLQHDGYVLDSDDEILATACRITKNQLVVEAWREATTTAASGATR